jgi:hypothetical protein
MADRCDAPERIETGDPGGATMVTLKRRIRMIAPALAVFVFAGSVAALPAPMQSSSADCREWRQCRQMALDAAERHEYEMFHDLAWRAVQTGNPKDPALLYLLARAQALSGRTHDAFVMLQRLAEMGVSSDAATNEDFKLTRELPGWSELAAQFDRLQRPGASSAAASPPAVNSPSRSSSAPASPPVVQPPGRRGGDRGIFGDSRSARRPNVGIHNNTGCRSRPIFDRTLCGGRVRV